MAYLDRDSDDRGLIFKIVGGAVAAIVIVLLAIGVLAWRANTPERLERQFDAEIAADPSTGPLFLELKASYPADYKSFVNLLIDLQQRGASKQEVQVRSHALAHQIMVSHVKDFRAAPAELLFITRDRNLELIRLLKAESETMCAHFATSGLQPGEIPSARALRKAAEVGVAQVRTMAAGRDHPVQRSAPTGADIRALQAKMAAHGVPLADFEAMLNGAIMGMPVDRQCTLGAALYQGLAELDDGPSERIGAVVLLPEQ